MNNWLTAVVLYGLACISIPGGWLATRPATAHQQYGSEFYANPAKATFHADRNCPWLNCEGEPAHFTGLGAAETFGQPCEHCLRELAVRGRVSAQPLVPTGPGPQQTRYEMADPSR